MTKASSSPDIETPPVMDLPLYWQGWANAIKLMDGNRTESDATSLRQAAAYEKCAEELRAALRASQPDTPIVARLRRAMDSTTDEVVRNDLREIVRDIEAAISSTMRRGPCHVCGETADLKCGPSRFGDETWACKDCWEPDGVAATSSQQEPGK